jgi:hypothetical protein
MYGLSITFVDDKNTGFVELGWAVRRGTRAKMTPRG